MRRLGILIASVALPIGAADAQQTAGESAYKLTLMCQVVAAHFGDQPAFQKSADAVRKMGRAQGYSDDKVSKDIFTMTSALGLEDRDQPGALTAHRNSCRKIGPAD